MGILSWLFKRKPRDKKVKIMGPIYVSSHKGSEFILEDFARGKDGLNYVRLQNKETQTRITIRRDLFDYLFERK